MTTYLGKSCSFGLLRVPFVNCRQFMYLVISLLVLRAGCGIWLYQFLIIAYLFTILAKSSIRPLTFSQFSLTKKNKKRKTLFFVCCLAHRGSTVGFLLLQCSSGVVRHPHISVESSSLLHHSIYLWFICFTWWSIDELENLHADRTTVCFEPW